MQCTLTQCLSTSQPGSNSFLGNFGSALVALDATVEFRNNSQTYFEGNEGLSGGAVTLFSKAFLLFGDNCHTTFCNNNATLHGGAISWPECWGLSIDIIT